MVKQRMTALLALLAMLLFSASLFAEGRNTYKIKSYIDENGDVVNVYRYAGFPPKELPQANDGIAKGGDPKAVFTLSNVPSYTWCYGCTATATAIIAAYYDNFGSPNVYTGPANSGVAPQTNTVWQTASQADTDQCPLAASKNGVDGRSTRGHGDDYWTGYLDEATDPYYGAWTEHDHESGQRAAADFMGTNQWYNWENADGSTSIWSSAAGVYDYTGAEGSTPALRDGIHGVRLFYESLGLTVDKNFTRTITGYDDPDDDPDMGPAVGGYEFAMYKESVDAGRPVYIQVEGHSMVGFGYDDSTTPPTLYLRDTWDTNTSPTAHSMPWGQTYSNMQHYAISEVVLGTECYWAAPENVFALNNNRSVTVSWDDPSKGTKNMSYVVFRDGAQIATGVTGTSYVDNAASDGTHNWSVKAYYVDDSYTSYMSKLAYAYVSASVTSFYDEFESGNGQWLFNPTSGGWGLDTQYTYSGSYSLSDSPGANYPDNTDQYDLGGGWVGYAAEVAPGLNFSAAADATCSFYLRYLIEESFDYLHFQACDDGITWETLKTWSSEASTAWALETISLGLFAGNSNVRFRFIMVTDPGYNTQGVNIDEFDISPSAVDSSAPYVYYTKMKDYYSPNADGFEITTDITDFTGIDYARVLYKVNGGSEQTANPSSVNGSTYFWKLPVQNPGDMVEFRFDVQDTYSTPNQGYKGPYYYVDGLHQKYDYATVSYYTEVVTSTADYDQKSYAVKFSSFYDDVVGAVVRGYDDASQPEDNADMLMNVWGDNSGLPGATLITPFSYTNPATLSDTNAWGYVDLSSYTALEGIEGDFYIGFECGTNPNTGVTRTTMTQTGEAGEFDFGRAYINYYLSGTPTWEQSAQYNHHIRCITTNYGITPGTIDPSPSALAETLAPDLTASQTLNVGNSGGFSLDYTATIDYNGFASGGTVTENTFESALGWTTSGSRTWTRTNTYDGGSLNGSYFAYCAANTGGAPTTAHTYLTSGTFNLSSFGTATVSFEQKMSNAAATGTLEASNDGTNWTVLYTVNAVVGAWGSPDTQSITVPAQFMTTTARFRFHAAQPKNSGYWAIDNILIEGSVPFNWMTLDGGTTTSGTVAAGGSDPITVGFNSAGLSDGSYTANIRLSSDYSNESVFVQLDVTSATPPAAPSLTSPANASNLVDITPYFDWSTVTEATAYNIVVDNNSDYSSPEIDTEVASSNYQETVNMATGTYYWKVRSKNAGGYSSFTSSWSVNIQSPVATPSVASLAGAALQGATDSDVFNITNDGNADLNYTLSVEYVTSKADLTLLTNDFNSGLGWTASDYLVWAQSSDLTYDLDGTAYGRLAADPDDDPNGSAAGVLTSPVFDGTSGYEVWIDFDQYANLLTSSCLVDYTINGTDWVNVYTNTTSVGASGTPDHQRVRIPEKSATMQVRFRANMKNQSGSHWNIDNIVIEGLNPANYGWLSVLPASGTITATNSTQFTASYDATGMDAGTFNANIVIASNDQYEPTQYIPVEFVVTIGTLETPANVVTSISGSNLVVDWDAVTGATSYDVYASNDPYGTFSVVSSVGTNQYTVAADQAKMFYYIVATNAKGAVKAATKKTIRDIKKEESGN